MRGSSHLSVSNDLSPPVNIHGKYPVVVSVSVIVGFPLQKTSSPPANKFSRARMNEGRCWLSRSRRLLCWGCAVAGYWGELGLGCGKSQGSGGEASLCQGQGSRAWMLSWGGDSGLEWEGWTIKFKKKIYFYSHQQLYWDLSPHCSFFYKFKYLTL